MESIFIRKVKKEIFRAKVKASALSIACFIKRIRYYQGLIDNPPVFDRADFYLNKNSIHRLTLAEKRQCISDAKTELEKCKSQIRQLYKDGIRLICDKCQQDCDVVFEVISYEDYMEHDFCLNCLTQEINK